MGIQQVPWRGRRKHRLDGLWGRLVSSIRLVVSGPIYYRRTFDGDTCMSAPGGSSIEDNIVLRRRRISEKFWDRHHHICVSAKLCSGSSALYLTSSSEI